MFVRGIDCPLPDTPLPLLLFVRKLYPKVPVGYPEGAQDEESTYLHLIDCYLEMKADQQLMSAERAKQVMDFWGGRPLHVGLQNRDPR